MRAKGYFIVIVLYILTTLITIKVLINVGFIPTPPTPTSYHIKQTFSNTLVSSFDASREAYVAQERLYIQNVTGEGSARILHFCLEYNTTGILLITARLIDQKSHEIITEKSIEYYLGTLIIDTGIKVDRPYYFFIRIKAIQSFTFKYNATIIQEIYL